MAQPIRVLGDVGNAYLDYAGNGYNVEASRDSLGDLYLHIYDPETNMENDPRGLLNLGEFDDLVNALIELRWRWMSEDEDEE